MATDKVRKYVLPNIPYLFIGWFCLKIGTAYRLATGTGFGEKLLGLGQTIGVAFASFAPSLAPLDWFVGIVGAVGFRLLIYCKAKKAKKFRRDAEYGTARWGNEKDIKPFVDPKFENNMLLPQHTALGVYHHIGRMSLQKLRREPKAGLAGAGRTDPAEIEIAGVGGIFGAGIHGKPFNSIDFSKSMHYNPLS